MKKIQMFALYEVKSQLPNMTPRMYRLVSIIDKSMANYFQISLLFVWYYKEKHQIYSPWKFQLIKVRLLSSNPFCLIKYSAIINCVQGTDKHKITLVNCVRFFINCKKLTCKLHPGFYQVYKACNLVCKLHPNKIVFI